MRAAPRAVAARYDRRTGRIVVTLDTGLELRIPPQIVQGLESARPANLAAIEISPTGLGLHFPKLDADVYIPGLLQGIFGSSGWMSKLMGQRGGKSTSAAKQAASRANGKLGGRPPRRARV